MRDVTACQCTQKRISVCVSPSIYIWQKSLAFVPSIPITIITHIVSTSMRVLLLPLPTTTAASAAAAHTYTSMHTHIRTIFRLSHFFHFFCIIFFVIWSESDRERERGKKWKVMLFGHLHSRFTLHFSAK